MKKKWSAKEKSQIVLEGIKGRPVVDICATYGVSQSLYYAWRDKFFANVSDVFEVDKKNGREQRILRENLKLKQSLAETILELKKNRRGLVKGNRKMKNLSSLDLVLLERIKELKSLHPFFGYRRIWAVLKFKDGLNLNKKKVYRLMKISDLLIKPNLLLRANRTPWKDKPRPERLNEWWGIDMTKIRLKHLGWVYITIVIDWCSKKLVGYSIDTKSKSEDWLIAVDMALNSQFPYGVKDEVEKRGYELNLMADNGCQPTSDKFKETCKNLGINLAFTSYNNPKGNADTERFMRTMKEECLWINEFDNLNNLTESLKSWFKEYNQNYLHSKLHYKSPIEFEAEFKQNFAENTL